MLEIASSPYDFLDDNSESVLFCNVDKFSDHLHNFNLLCFDLHRIRSVKSSR